MAEPRDETHEAALAVVRHGSPLDSLLTRSELRHLVREARDWYVGAYADGVGRRGTCVVVTAGPPGAGKSSILRTAIDDLSMRLVIDADIAKDHLARWCATKGLYADLLGTPLPDGGVLRPRELRPLLQTTSTEVCNAVRRAALLARMDVVIEGTMASPAYGDRLLQSLAKDDYDRLHIVSVETDRETAGKRAVERWWQGRNEDSEMGGRLILPETIDHAYTEGQGDCKVDLMDGAGLEWLDPDEYFEILWPPRPVFDGEGSTWDPALDECDEHGIDYDDDCQGCAAIDQEPEQPYDPATWQWYLDARRHRWVDEDEDGAPGGVAHDGDDDVFLDAGGGRAHECLWFETEMHPTKSTIARWALQGTPGSTPDSIYFGKDDRTGRGLARWASRPPPGSSSWLASDHASSYGIRSASRTSSRLTRMRRPPPSR
ncbi:zeta toxin family protein [Isoptericola sp. NEAU-Y5]|uniref:UDP-N-acetylglucosamine kinase n=1 Tax=Isoptericola luteus TaxID=2879484 RepID=A0ABS7ZII2_9MICO|nr:zeta toxin family protein [Isoptericola sp. NEAU-Y5]MCA5894840.1 zeta toxin family protein [Isoptericola sp. NEAU-Y5]